MPPAIKVQNLGKEYVIGSKEKGNETFREMLLSSLSAPFRRFTQSKGESEQEERFWALNDVSFEIQPGEVVGIIGRNGAGKSTLLKILSRITEPTQGEISIRGRVASLLEVGTGFHPELTGRENIYLNGAILGMSRAEIKRKFDEIVEFSEVEKFLDTPVKRYSSGMYVRLAFAVAAHLEPEILIVDEVLAVGDAGFQKKCLGKLNDVAKAGRTVLFVSHNMAAIEGLCEKALWMDAGKLVQEGSTDVLIRSYMQVISDKAVSLFERTDRVGRGRITFLDTWTEDSNGNHQKAFLSGDGIVLNFKFQASSEIKGSLAIGVGVKDGAGQWITDLSSECSGFQWHEVPTEGLIRCFLPDVPINSGTFYYSIIARVNGEIEDFVLDVGSFSVDPGDFFGTGAIHSVSHGVYLFNQKWSLQEV